MASKAKEVRRPDLSSSPLSPRLPPIHPIPYPVLPLPASKLRSYYQELTNIPYPVIPYQEPAPGGDSADFSSTLSSTLPMAAIFMRNRYVGWAAFVYSVQSWLGESADSKKNSSTPGYFSVGMSREFP